MDLGTAKILGLIGVVIELVGALAGATGYGLVLSIIGFILVLIAIHGLAEISGIRAIFNKYLQGCIFVIIGIIVAVIVILYLGLMTVLSTFFLGPHGFAPAALPLTILFAIIIAFIIMYVFLVLGYMKIKESYHLIADTFNHNTFRTVGTIYFIGAILTIIIVGLLLLFIGTIVELIAWATLPTTRRRKEYIETQSYEEPII